MPDCTSRRSPPPTREVPPTQARSRTRGAVGRVGPLPQAGEEVVAEIADPDVGADPGLLEGLAGAAAADAVDVGQGDFQPLLARQVDADKACHVGSCSFA